MIMNGAEGEAPLTRNGRRPTSQIDRTDPYVNNAETNA